MSRLLAEQRCVDCGVKDPVVFEFDHVRGKKVSSIGELMHKAVPWQTIAHEMAKCEIRCANCHRRRTAAQFGWKVRKLTGVETVL